MDLTEALLHRYTTSVVSILNAVRGVASRTRARSRRSRAARVGGRLPARAIEDAGGALRPSIAIVIFLGTSTLEATHGWFPGKNLS